MVSNDSGRRYLVHFAGGGAGIRTFDDPPKTEDELLDGGRRYRLTQVEHRDGDSGFGHAWAEPVPKSE
jgi:hypothetical protein